MKRHVAVLAGLAALACTQRDGGQTDDSGAWPPPAPCEIPDAPADAVAFTRLWAWADFEGYTDMVPLPDGERWLFLQRSGEVRWIDANPVATTLHLALSLPESLSPLLVGTGALSMALDPDFESNGHLYVAYAASGGTTYRSRIARFTSEDGGDTFDPASMVVIYEIDQDGEVGWYCHADLLFGPDGYLYASFGDAGDEDAQDPHDPFGTILRLDVSEASTEAPFRVPEDNPFAGGAGGLPEVWAFGFRNPWRMAFSRDGDLYVGDVGASSREEIDLVTPGGNYGWPLLEGTLCRAAGCDDPDLLPPVGEYDHGTGSAVMLGAFYEGDLFPELKGRLLFSDYLTGRLFALEEDGEITLLGDSGRSIAAMERGNDGEVLMLDYQEGWVLAVTPPGPPGYLVPERLSETGCMDPAQPSRPGPLLTPYEINVPFWSDGAAKARWFRLPEGGRVTVDGDGVLGFPIGTVMVKQFEREGAVVETRLLSRHRDGTWGGYVYAWDEDQDDGHLLHNDVAPARGWPDQEAPWTYPTRAQCLQCHNEAVGRTIGPEVVQLDRPVTRDGVEQSQIAWLAARDVFAWTPPATHPALAPTDGTRSLEERARSWLHANCSNCHRPGTSVQVDMDLRAWVPLSATSTCDVPPEVGNLGLSDPRRIAPGHPERSVLWHRLAHRQATQMPPLATALVDESGAQLIADWIESLEGCD